MLLKEALFDFNKSFALKETLLIKVRNKTGSKLCLVTGSQRPSPCDPVTRTKFCNSSILLSKAI